MSRPRLSRRVALAVPAILTLGATPAPSVAALDPDQELLSLCRRYLSVERRYRLLTGRECEADEAGDEARAERLRAVMRRFLPYLHELLDGAVNIPARTPSGLYAKAEVCMSRVQFAADGAPWGADGPMWSLCRDLLRQENLS
jgi:hypothetical protein